MLYLAFLLTRFAAGTDTVALLAWLSTQPAPSVISHVTLAEALDVDCRRIGQVLGNLVHVQHFHGVNAFVRIGRAREHGRRVSLWQLNPMPTGPSAD